jgi:hypothetical protein
VERRTRQCLYPLLHQPRLSRVHANQDDGARLELEAARVICEANANGKGDHGDVARVLRLLADAHKQRGDFEEAEKLHAEAEGIRRRVQGGRYHTLPDTYESYQLMVWSGYR